MKKLTLAAVLLACTALASPASADDVLLIDPLHGMVCTSASGGCSNAGDNGTNTPIATNPPVNFGFAATPAQSGALQLDLLIPNNITIPAGFPGIQVTGTSSGLATLFSPTAWTSGTLNDYLFGAGNVASPSNPLNAYLPATQALVGNSATGFFVFQASVGDYDLDQPSNTNPTDIFSLNVFAQGGYIVGFLTGIDKKGDPFITATANSAALLETTPGNSINPQCTGACAVPGPIVGAGLPGLLAALGGMLGLNFHRRRRRMV